MTGWLALMYWRKCERIGHGRCDARYVKMAGLAAPSLYRYACYVPSRY